MKSKLLDKAVLPHDKRNKYVRKRMLKEVLGKEERSVQVTLTGR